MFNNSFNTIYFFIIFITVFICVLFIPFFPNYSNINFEAQENFTFTSSYFLWPVPGYTTITSYFGKRIAPTTGASTYHSGIDIAAPVDSKLIALSDGEISYLGFNGAGGYTIILKNETFSVSYCHVSPNFIVSVGDYIYKGQKIGSVGPLNVYGVENNPYKDKYGRPTNRGIYWTSFTFNNKKRRQSRQSFRLFKIITYRLLLIHLLLNNHAHNYHNVHYIRHHLLRSNLVRLYYHIQDISLLS